MRHDDATAQSDSDAVAAVDVDVDVDAAAQPTTPTLTPLHQVVAWAMGRGGVSLRADARAGGLPERSYTRAMRRLGLEPGPAGQWTASGAQLDVEQHLALVDEVLGVEFVVTGQLGLWLRRVSSVAPDHVSIVVGVNQHVERAWEVRVHRSIRFVDLASARIDGIRVAQPARCVADLASEGLGVDALTDRIGAGCAKRRSLLDEVGAELAGRRRFPGRAALRRAHAALCGELSHSRTEQRGRTLARRADARFTSRPYPVDDGGGPIAELDAAIVELRYGLDVDGPPHLLPWVAENDRRRDRRLAAHGWSTDRFLWREIERDPDGFVAEVARNVAHREQGAG